MLLQLCFGCSREGGCGTSSHLLLRFHLGCRAGVKSDAPFSGNAALRSDPHLTMASSETTESPELRDRAGHTAPCISGAMSS
ncbi:hypothetical protein CesoFtcFv8_000524 [Champsocephalus esox]|uniref:Uncharacterized protein n=1 Tax=Champsocephalus esox TaxID=159716 RepID=A0AAN8DBV0_9TELE|nr:hypothetical protein CesoFtcFv8_000524 [Champsocephalus esox]